MCLSLRVFAVDDTRRTGVESIRLSSRCGQCAAQFYDDYISIVRTVQCLTMERTQKARDLGLVGGKRNVVLRLAGLGYEPSKHSCLGQAQHAVGGAGAPKGLSWTIP